MGTGGTLEQSALIVTGHGSEKNKNSSQATRDLVDEIRSRELFAEVHAVFWKEDPHFRDSFDLVACREVFVVPHFISEGYFTQEVIPRELGLSGSLTERDGLLIRYCDPVGCHPRMTDLLLSRAREVGEGIDPSETSVLVLGHGTERNKNSAQAVRDQVERIRQSSEGYGEVVGVFLDESPSLREWADLTHLPNVIVLPYLIAAGLHFSRDLPGMLGVPGDESGQPYEIGSRKVYYSLPVGGDPAMADLVIDLVRGFEVE